MRTLFNKVVTYAAAAALVGAGILIIGPSPARAAVPGDGGGGESGGLAVPWFGIGAIAVIATLAIWQGVVDARKKKQLKQKEGKELEEEGEFEEYFKEEPKDPADEVPPAPEETPSGDAEKPPVEIAP